MDSEHRHELQENDLAEFIANFGEWWSKHGNTVLTVILVVSVVFLGKRWIDARAESAHEQAWSDLATATSPESFRHTAESHDNPAVRALAYLQGGDLLLAQSKKNQDASPDAAPSTAPPLTPDQALHEAELMYKQVLADPNTHTVFKLNAHLGLATVAESRQLWNEAQQQYQAIIDTAGPGYDAIAGQARARLANLDELAKPIYLVEPTPQLSIDPIDSLDALVPQDGTQDETPDAASPDELPSIDELRLP